MAISVFPIASSSSGDPASQTFAAASAGTYSLSTPLTAGLYEIRTGNVSLTLGFKTSGGHLFQASVVSGSGFISIPATVTQIVVPGTSLPISINLRLANFTQIPAPTSASFAFTVGNTSNYTFTAPAGATNMTAYFADGTNLAFNTTTSPKNTVTTPGAANTSPTVILVAKDAKGVDGIGATITATNTVFIPFTGGTVHTYTENDILYFANLMGSGTLTMNNTRTVDWVLIGGGSGGGGNYNGARGGAGGGVLAQSGMSLAAGTYNVVVGGGASPTGGGGNSTFNGMTALGMNGNDHVQPNSGTATGSGTFISTGIGGSGAGQVGGINASKNAGNGTNSLGGWSFPASIVGSSGYVAGGGPGLSGGLGTYGLGDIGAGGTLYSNSAPGAFLIRTAVV